MLPYLGLLCAAVATTAAIAEGPVWDFDRWLGGVHDRTLPACARMSQAGKQGLEPLLSFSREGRPVVVKTWEDWERRRAEIREALLDILGRPQVTRAPLAPQVLEEVELPNAIRRKVSYGSEPGERISAYLFLPKGLRGRAPAVICLHQTVTQGKDEPAGITGSPDLAFCPQLVAQGYVALAPDAVCFGERYHAGEPYHHYGDATPFAERHPEWSLMGKMVFDVGVAVDYLQTLDCVDSKRIACLGHSHGAYGTIFAMALEPRLQAGIASCGFTTLRSDPTPERWWRLTALMPRLGFWEQDIAQTPLDFQHILALIAPRAFFNSTALADACFPHTDNVPALMEDVRRVYALYGAADRLEEYAFPGEHAFPAEARARAYDWLGKQVTAGGERH